jgi:hypothetical protein
MSRDLKHLSPVLTLFILIFLQLTPAFGRDFVYQNQNTQGQTQVEVENLSSRVQTVWVLLYGTEFIEEHAFDIEAKTKKILDITDFMTPDTTFAILTKSSLVHPIGEDARHAPTWNWEPGTHYEITLPSSNQVSLKIFNLYLEQQKVSLRYLNAAGATLSSSTLTTDGFRKNLEHLEDIPNGSTTLIVESEAPILLTSSEIVRPVTDTRRVASTQMHYFLLQGGSSGSSFVVPMDDPAMIQRARQEILIPQGYMVFADIELNKTQANRDFSTPEKIYWSWSVKKVTGMSQIAADWCQAYPEMIERMLHTFVRQQSVCFQGEKIIRELKPSEVESGILNPK